MKNFDLIKEIHSTVAGTVKDLQNSGWQRISRPKVGSVVVWQEKKYRDGQSHKHLGFYIGKQKAVSNSTRTGKIATHHWTFGTVKGRPRRKVEEIHWYNKLN